MSESLKIVTYNLRCCWDGDGINSFIHRAGMIWEKFREEKPDVVAFQEVMPKALELLKCILPEYDFFGQGRNADFDGEGLYTAVRRTAVSAVGFETFWIGPKPYEPESSFDDQSECPRICVSSLLRHRETNRLFRVYNVHLDHLGSGAREKGIRCVLRQMAQAASTMQAPFVLLGDFNDTPDSKTIHLCKADESIGLFDTTSGITLTFHGFEIYNYSKGVEKIDDKIDYIFVSKDLRNSVVSVSTWEDVRNGVYLSDHYPVCTELRF